MVTDFTSNKSDRKEREMKDGNENDRRSGRFLPRGKGHIPRYRQWLMIAILMIWDSILLYMIIENLIAPVYGAAFVGVISIYLGHQL